MKYAVIVEKAGDNYSAHSPDAPGCGATGQSVEEALRMIKEAIEFHLEGLALEGLPIPRPRTLCNYVEVEIDIV